MQCHMCGENEAVLHFKQICYGKVKEVWVCRDCAEKHGISVGSPMSITDFLFGVDAQSDILESEKGSSCSVCGLRRSEFDKTSRVGCETCYAVFADELDSMLSSMHRGTVHVGKAPHREKVAMAAAELRGRLEKAVAVQDYEGAARIRDELRGLEHTETES